MKMLVFLVGEFLNSVKYFLIFVDILIGELFDVNKLFGLEFYNDFRLW